MKRIVTLFLVLSTFVFAENTTPVISATGRGVVSVKPDTLRILAVVETSDTNSKVAIEKNNEIINRTLSLLKSVGVTKNEIKVQNYSLNYRNDYVQKDVKKYFVSNEILISSKSLNKVDKILGALNQGGVTNIGTTEFTIENRKNYEEKAYQLAYQEAKDKAKAIAKLENKTITPKEISLNYSSPRVLTNAMVKQDNPISSVPVTVPSNLEITADVSASFYLR